MGQGSAPAAAVEVEHVAIRGTPLLPVFAYVEVSTHVKNTQRPAGVLLIVL